MNGINTYIAGIFLIMLIVPPCRAIAGRLPGIWICIFLGLLIGGWWSLVAISWGQWFQCLIVLLTFALLIYASMDCLVAIGVQSPIALSIVTLIAFLWLTWPIWLSASLAGMSLDWSVALNPVLAINHVVANLGIWTEQQVAYNVTALGQDVQYRLPTSIWPVCVFQVLLATVLNLCSRRFSPRAL